VAESLPLFPLGTVLLPSGSLPLHIFEPRYRQLTVDLCSGKLPGKRFGIVAVRPGWSVAACDIEEVQSIGCTAEIREATRLPDGRFELLTTGGRRFRLRSIDPDAEPYLMAEVDWLPDLALPADSRAAMDGLAAAARAAHARYLRAAPAGQASEPDKVAEARPEELAHLIASDCLLADTDRQRLLEQRCPARRLQMVRRVVNRETGIRANLHAVPTPVANLGPRASAN
jgi:Lon protease-like protein